jgi:hypothetical protein
MNTLNCSKDSKGSRFSRLKRFLFRRRLLLILIIKLIVKVLNYLDGE